MKGTYSTRSRAIAWTILGGSAAWLAWIAFNNETKPFQFAVVTALSVIITTAVLLVSRRVLDSTLALLLRILI